MVNFFKHQKRQAPLSGTGEAHGKSILIGEHAVVYGAPAIAFPLHDLKVKATVTGSAASHIDSEVFSGAITIAPERLRPPLAAMHEAAGRFGLDPDRLHLRVNSPIPVERGLGSSAAVSTAIVRAVADAAGQKLTDSERFALVQHAEQVAHGTSSGLDAHAVAADTALRFRSGTPTPLRSKVPVTLVIADTGNPGKTSIAVGGVRQLRENHPRFVNGLIDKLASLTDGAERALLLGTLPDLGQILTEAHFTLDELGVSSPDLNALSKAAREAGALGAKMTGGGLGGCIIALSPNAEAATEIAERVSAAGAARTWVSTLEQNV